uniref:Transcription factor HES-5 n=1 Tax=Geotrypetes seraphini TaxID=260995 RepID=A0A6P8P9C8_GEOSA|nr:transcription factor HES-5-like [Geotrypetes seraphini]
MAPTNLSLHLLTSKEKNKLRKPVVEKMRRDRINSSIEQLKLLLEREFQGQQPSTKLEKADVLEMAVSYLQLHRSKSPAVSSQQQEYSQGFSWCLKEALRFLSVQPATAETCQKLLSHLKAPHSTLAQRPGPQQSCPIPAEPAAPQQTALKNCSARGLWRPW